MTRTQRALLFAGLLVSAPALAAERTLSFAIYEWSNAVYETRFGDECPEGIAVSNDEIWWRSLSPKDRAKLTNNGLHESGTRHGTAVKRGPNGENVCLAPTVVEDPPMRTVEGPTSYGENIDGNEDGSATAKTCAHQNFTSPDGVKGIDNQMYRLIGCVHGWRTNGLIDRQPNGLRRASGLGMILVEISGVVDPRNSPDVTVTFYRSIDQFILDGTSMPLPYGTYRIDMVDGKPRYGDKLKGKIVDGVLTTHRGDVRLPYYGNYAFINPVIRDMGIRLEIKPDGSLATGMLTGYYEVAPFTHYVEGLGGIIPVSYYSCPAFHAAAYKLADGYPDPKTGQCTALSSAFWVTATPAFILHPESQRAQAR